MRNVTEDYAIIGPRTKTILASKIIWFTRTIDEGTINNMRRLEATAEKLMSSIPPESTTIPKLPPELASDWMHYFLEPIFKQAKKARID